MQKLLSILLTLVMLLSMVACASSSANEDKQESAAPATESYKIAVAEKYRFFSFGDAMFIQ